MELLDLQKNGDVKRKRQELWDVRAHWKLMEEAQATVDDEEDDEESKKDNDQEDSNNMEIWEDEMNMLVLNGNQFST